MTNRPNLRELFVGHEQTYDDEAPLESGTVSLENSHERNPFVVFRKEPGTTMYVIGEEGENIIAVQKPRRVLVPFAEYNGGAEYLEAAIQDRLFALIETAAVRPFGATNGSPESFPQVTLEQIGPFLRERLGHPLKAILANDATCERLRPHLAGIDAYSYQNAVQNGLVYGVAEPKYVGHIVTDVKRSGSSSAHVAMHVHGGIVGVRIKD